MKIAVCVLELMLYDLPQGTGLGSIHSDDGKPFGWHNRGTWGILLPGNDASILHVFPWVFLGLLDNTYTISSMYRLTFVNRKYIHIVLKNFVI